MARPLNNKEIHRAFGTEKDSSKETDPNKKSKLQKKIAAIALAITIFAGSSIGFGVSKSMNNAAANAEANAEAKKQMQEEVVANPQEIEYQRIESYSKAMDKYEEMDVATFENLPREERVMYSQFLIDKNESKGNYDLLYAKIEGQKSVASEYALPVVEVSENNTGQEIENSIIRNKQNASMLSEDDDMFKKPFLPDESQKGLSSVYYYTQRDTMVSGAYLAEKKMTEESTSVSYVAQKLTVTNTSELQSGVDREGNDILYKDIVFVTSKTKETVHDRAILLEFPNYDGSTDKIWLSSTPQ